MLRQVKTVFQIDDVTISKIQAWAEKKFEMNKLLWVDNFADYETVLEYKQTFFSHLKDVYIYSIYLSAADSKSLIEEFDND